MPKIKHNSPATLSWAKALIELAEQGKQMEPIGAELGQIASIIHQDHVFARFLADPAIGQQERGAVLDKVFAGRVSPLVRNFLGVMNERGAAGLLAEVADAYKDLLDAKLGKVEVDVTVAQPLSAEALDGVRRRISDALRKDAIIHQNVDDRIIGGMVLRVGDRLIDGSVKAQLQAMHEQLLNARRSVATTNA